MRRRGFTLLEMVVYASVLAVLVGLLGYVLVRAYAALQGNRLQQETLLSAQAGLERMMAELRESSLSDIRLMEDSNVSEIAGYGHGAPYNMPHQYLRFSIAGVIFPKPYVSDTGAPLLTSTAQDLPWTPVLYAADPVAKPSRYVCYYVGNSPGLPQDLASIVSGAYSKALYRCEVPNDTSTASYIEASGSYNNWNGLPDYSKLNLIKNRKQVLGYPKVLVADHIAPSGTVVGGDANTQALGSTGGTACYVPYALFLEPYGGTFAVDGFRIAIRYHRDGSPSTTQADFNDEHPDVDVALAIAVPIPGAGTYNVVCVTAQSVLRN